MAFVSSSKTESTETDSSQNPSLAPTTVIEKKSKKKVSRDISANDDGVEHGKADKRDEGTTNNDNLEAPQQLEMEPVQLEDQLRALTKQVEEDREQREILERELQELQSAFSMPGHILPNWYASRSKNSHYKEESNKLLSSERLFIEDNEDYELMRTHRMKMIALYRLKFKYLDVPGSKEFDERDREIWFSHKDWATSYLRVLEKELEVMNGLQDERALLTRDLDFSIRLALISNSHNRSNKNNKADSTGDAAEPSAQGVILMGGIMAGQVIAERDSFAIDVLRGEPDLVFDFTAQHHYPRKSLRCGNEDENEAEGKTPVNMKKHLPGQGPLPERIRIHSRQILKILSHVSGGNLSTTNCAVVMIRPFRALAYYRDQIRQRLQDLESKYGIQGQQGEQPDKSHVASPHPEPKGRGDDTKAASAGTTGDLEPQYRNAFEEQKQESGGQVGEMEKSEKGEKDMEEEDLDTTSIIALQQLRCLNELMDTEIQAKMNYLASDRCKTVAFTDLWYLFSPGEEVVGQDRRQAYRVVGISSTFHNVIPPKRKWEKSSTTSVETPVILECVYIDFNGKQLGPVIRRVEIPRYDGEKAVSSLEVYPLRFTENPKSTVKDGFRRSLIARGRGFLDVTRVKHMHYNGLTLEARDEVDSQVVIDFEEAFSSSKSEDAGNSYWKPAFASLIEASMNEKALDVYCPFECCKDEVVHYDAYAEKKRSQDYVRTLIPEDRNKEPSIVIYPRALQLTMSPDNVVTEDELVIMSYRVFGFVLRSRKWAKLDLAYLSPIGPSNEEEIDADEKREAKSSDQGETKKQEKRADKVFDQLVLPRGHKEMVLSLIAQHFRDKESTMADKEQIDIVRGKGKGLIILLHGLPGVGKTTTAEGVAKLFQKPLFQITCGDLGTTAAEVESALEKHFALASRWECILLLDEADVFLAARTPQDFKRNGLVAVFLRVLEYYSGVLFLTTNRIGDFDEAFASRIHISLHYPELKLEPTREIFKLNLRLIRDRFPGRGRKIDIDEKSILDFAETYWTQNENTRWNGRQIRNACQTALALTEFDAQGGSHERVVDAHAEVKLKVDHLETVSKAYLQFIEYLRDIYGVYGERRAKNIGIRAREVEEKEQEDEDFFEGKNIAATTSHTGPVPAIGTLQPEHHAPGHGTMYPYPPPNVPSGGYPPWGAGYNYPPPPAGYHPAGWQPPQGAGAGPYGSA